MTKYSGSCLCGKVSFAITTAFTGFFLCHCSRCQKNSGSAHASNLFAKEGGLQWETGQEHVKTYRVDDTRFITSFCDTCGSSLPSVGSEGSVAVPAGSLDSRIEIKPTAHIFWQSKACWEENLHEVKKFDDFPR